MYGEKNRPRGVQSFNKYLPSVTATIDSIAGKEVLHHYYMHNNSGVSLYHNQFWLYTEVGRDF